MNKTILVKELRCILGALKEDDLLFVNGHGDIGVLRDYDNFGRCYIGYVDMTQNLNIHDRWSSSQGENAYLYARNPVSGKTERITYEPVNLVFLRLNDGVTNG